MKLQQILNQQINGDGVDYKSMSKVQNKLNGKDHFTSKNQAYNNLDVKINPSLHNKTRTIRNES